MKPLACAVVRDIDDLERVSGAWRALLDRSAHNVPTLSPLWLTTWWRTFGGLGGRALRVALFYDGDRLVGLAPLLARMFVYRQALPFRRLELVGTGEDEADEICSDYVGPLAERGREEEIAWALTSALAEGRLGAWDELVLPAMDGSQPLPALLTGALNRAGLPAERVETGACPYIPLPATWKAYLAQLPSQSRYLVTRSLRDFEAWAGAPPSLCVARSESELADGKRKLASLHGERWRADGADGVFASPRFTAFHDAVMTPLLREGALELAWLEARSEPVAALYNIVWDKRVHFYQSGRKIDVPKNVRPGIVAHALAIQRAIDAGRREYDFLAGTSQYKRKLALARRPIVQVRAVRAPLRERARQGLESAVVRLRALRGRLRRTPEGPATDEE